jgi:phosphohistidine phosphatase
MIVIFLRHGQKEGSGDAAPLTDRGRAQAAEAGRWLAAQGLRPTDVVHTHARRTRDTAAEALQAMGLTLAALGVTTERSLPRYPEKWDAFVSGLEQRLPADAVVLTVGHNPTDDLFCRQCRLGPPPKGRKRRLVAVFRPGPDGWATCAVHPIVD